MVILAVPTDSDIFTTLPLFAGLSQAAASKHNSKVLYLFFILSISQVLLRDDVLRCDNTHFAAQVESRAVGPNS